jgi:hypothetical protein
MSGMKGFVCHIHKDMTTKLRIVEAGDPSDEGVTSTGTEEKLNKTTRSPSARCPGQSAGSECREHRDPLDVQDRYKDRGKRDAIPDAPSRLTLPHPSTC